jgi:glycosyltransferase involved in cell wall biosynthesis
VQRFAIIAPNFYPRVCGIGDHSARLAAELQRRGHEAVVFSRAPAERNPEEPGVEVHGVAGSHPIAIAHDIAALLAERRPTNVLLQYTAQMWDASRFGSVAMALLAAQAKQQGARVTLIAHEPFVPWYRRPDLFMGAFTQRVYFAALLKSCDQVMVTTETRLRYVTPYCSGLHLTAARVSRVGANALPVPRTLDAERPSGAPPGPRIGVFSTAAVGKRFDVVLDAFARVAGEIPAAQLVLIGDFGPSDLRGVREINQRLHQHPNSDRIRVTGRLPLTKIAQEVADLDVYLFPMATGANTRSGTLPVALGSGLPVVAILGFETDVDLFRDGENILFARDLGGASFAEATLRLLRDRPLRTRVAAGARRLYLERLSWERIVDELLAAL